MSTGFLTGLNNRVKNATTSSLGQFNNSKFVRGTKSFLSSNSLVAKIVFLILVAIVFVLLIRWGAQILTYIMAPSKSPKLISGMKQGYVAKVVHQDPAISGSIPVMRSTNQRDGLEFTYTVWLFINHLQKTGTRKHIFHKGSPHTGGSDNGTFYPNNAPGVYIHPTRNTLVVVMNTCSNQFN